MRDKSEIASLRRQLAEARTTAITAGNMARLAAQRVKEEVDAEVAKVREEAAAREQRMDAEIQRLQGEADAIKARVANLEARPATAGSTP